MTRYFKFLVLFLLVFSLLPVNTFGATTTDILYFEDGSCIITELTVQESRSGTMKTASRTAVHKDSNGFEKWRATLTATFIYDGMTAACTDARCEVSITDTDWYVISKTADATGDTAAAYVTMGRKMAGVTVERKSVELSIICDGVGNLS